MVNDFDNKIIREEGVSNYQPLKKDLTVSIKALATVMENDKNTASLIIDYNSHYHKEYYVKEYTEVVILFESHKSEKNIKTAQEALNHFINSYRMVSDDILTLPIEKMTFVSRVYKEYFHTYSGEELLIEETQRLKTSRGLGFGVKSVMLPFWNIQGKKFLTDPIKNVENLTSFFFDEKIPDALSDFILKAREELHIHNNFKYSFIESWTALEIAIVGYLKKIKLEKGISKNKLDDLEGEVGISYLLNIELPLVYQDPKEPRFKELIGRIDGIRRLRNKSIHENQVVSELDAKNALQTAIDFLNFIGYKKY